MTSPPPKTTNGFNVSKDLVINKINPLQREVANELGVHLIDISQMFQNMSGGYDAMLRDVQNNNAADGIHLSEAGAQFVAQKVEAKIFELQQ